MTDDAARRERAETDALAWVRRNCTVEEIRVQEAGLVRGYLAGAREEAAIWTDASQCGHPDPCTLGPLCPYCEIGRQKAEMAALRERLATYQRAVLFLYDSAYGRLPAEAVLDERWKIVKQLVSEVER